MRKVIYLFIIWRIALFAVAAISPLAIPQFGARFPYFQERLITSGFPHFIWSFGNFDGVHYLGIAKDGYAYQFTQVFFPLYPVLIRLASYITLGNFLLSGLLISNAAFLFGLIIFFKFVREIYSQKIALWSCLFLLTFPTSYYFGAIYTEGLFFLLVISAFYLFYKKRILLASIIGSFASLARLTGLFLAPSLALKRDFKSLIPILIIPVGFLIYVLYLKIEFNNPLYFLSAQSIFGQERLTNGVVLLPQVFWRYLKILATTHGLIFANAAFELLSTVFALTLLLIAYKQSFSTNKRSFSSNKKIKIEWLVFSLIAILVPTLTGTLASMPRYILVAFPIYIILAQLKNLKIKVLILTVSTILLFVATTLFAQGYWVA